MNPRRRILFAVLSLVTCFVVGGGFGSGVARAQSVTAAAGPVLYALGPTSLYEEGCFGACACPVTLSDSVVGTWVMTAAAPDPLYQNYDITAINWFLPQQGVRITGTGHYKIGGEVALMQELSLDLLIGDQAVQHFDSGLVQGGADFPVIDISVALNGFSCNDKVFRLSASPDMVLQIPYMLGAASLYEEGCFGTCACAVKAEPLAGRFGFVKLRDTALETDWAVVDVRWLVRTSPYTAALAGTPVTGNGVYVIHKDGTGQRLMLDLIENGVGPTRFDSGLVPGGQEGPDGGPPRRLDISVAANGFACTDRVYAIHAKRRDAASVDLGATRTDPVTIGVTPVP
jgi:hypothetical protein